VKWHVDGRGTVCERDTGENAMIRSFDEITLVGVGEWPWTDGDGYLQPMTRDRFWEASGPVGDPTLATRADEIARASADAWAAIFEKIADDAGR